MIQLNMICLLCFTFLSLVLSTPTPSPTIDCEDGYYLFSGTCTECPTGTYKNSNVTECTDCSPGKYANNVGRSTCVECDTGKLSNSDNTACEDCDAGKYTYNKLEYNNTACVSCEYGKYAPVALDTSCIYCGAGYYTNNNTGATECPACDAGKFSNGSTDSCTECAVGRYSGNGVSSCTVCAIGTYTNSEGSTSCSDCSAGRYTNQYESTSCSDCEAGKYQEATKQSFCYSCESGTYARSGAYYCETCEFGYSSIPASSRCDIADENYYLLNVTASPKSEDCPKNAYCAGGLYAPAPLEGYWSDRSSYDYSDVVYQCSRGTCQGLAKFAGSLTNSSCWHQNAFPDLYNASTDAILCDASEVLCSTGSWGHLCGSCQPGYIFRGAKQICEECNLAKQNVVVVFVIGGSAVAMVLVGMLLLKYVPWFSRTAVFRFVAHIDTGSIKVVWVTYQIIASTSFNLDITYPSPYQELLAVFSFFSFDFLALECFQDAEDRYYTSLILWSSAPIVASLFIFVTYFFRVGFLKLLIRYRNKNKFSNGNGEEEEELDEEYILERAHAIKVQHVWMFLLLTYLVLPPVAMKQLQSLDCIPFPHDGSSYLRVDTVIDCQGTDYLEFRVFVIFFIIIYQLIPILWLWLLYRQREALNPSVSSSDARLALYIRDKDPNLGPIRFLFDSYKTSRWWFEVVEMYRRVIFVSIIPLTSTVKATRASLGCVLAIMSILYYREENPFRREFTNVIAYVAQAAILITFYSALSIETGIMIDFGLSDLGMGIFLVVVNISVFGLLLHVSLSRLRTERRLDALKHETANGLEVAVGFSAEKFATTFGSVVHTVVPASHTLVFHYTTAFGARRALKSGIPAHEALDGVLVSEHQPHQLTAYDEAFFEKHSSFPHELLSKRNNSSLASFKEGKAKGPFAFEAVLALALPSRILHRIDETRFDISSHNGKKLKTTYQGSGLYFIPAPLLNALRPNEFTAVIEPTPWADNVLMLPPTPIVRAYQLISDEEFGRLNKFFGYDLHSHHKKGKFLNFGAQLMHHIKNEDKIDDQFFPDDDDDDGSEMGGTDLDAPLTKTGKKALPSTTSSKSPASTKSSNKKGFESSEEAKAMNRLLDKQSSDKDKGNRNSLDDDIESVVTKSPKNTKKRRSSGLMHSLYSLATTSRYSTELTTVNETKGGGGGEQSSDVPNSSLRKTPKASNRNKKGKHIETPETMLEFTSRMRTIRRRCAATGKVPLYHYTQLSVASLILKTGLRMSRQGQGDGGVYFSTLGPCSYGLGSSELGSTEVYEEMIIKDCFGVERMEEYKGKGKLDVVIVYGITPLALQPAPGGRDNAKVVTKATFQDLSLPHEDGNFFLHEAAVMGAFLIRTSNPLKCDAISVEEAEGEVISDEAIRVEIDETLVRLAGNTAYFASKDNSSPANLFLKRK